MTGYVGWQDIRAEYVQRAGGDEAVEACKQELLAEVGGHRFAEIRRRGLTQQQVADRMGITRGHVSQIEQGKFSSQDVRDSASTMHSASSDHASPACATYSGAPTASRDLQ